MNIQSFPTTFTHHNWVERWRLHNPQYISDYVNGNCSFIPNLLPETSVKLDVFQVLDILHKKIGSERLVQALYHHVPSPLSAHTNSQWLKQSNVVGINVRTIGNFWNVIKYLLTVPQSHDCIHLLPIWEPGVVGSLYGTVSWKINDEFFSHELARAVPSLDTVEKQLKVVVNLIHALGKTVGLDVIPHTDRFSEVVITHPRLFEWVRRDKAQIADHSENLWQQVETAIWNYLQHNGTGDYSPLWVQPYMLFEPSNPDITDDQRQNIIFGPPHDPARRLYRRIQFIQHLIYEGFETLPMTMAPPYRGLHINPKEFVVDERGTRWYQYDFDKPQQMSRVFGPLTRYRFYHSKNYNANWELDFDNPHLPAWNYFQRKYLECQMAFNFDFMRGDMAHVQMRPKGVPAKPNDFYDPLLATKKHIQQKVTPHFAFYAETFLAPPDTMGYGDEVAHLEAIQADSTLGDLQSTAVGDSEFMMRFADYTKLLKTKNFAPSFTILTADKDDPRFDIYFKSGNMLRYFIGLFLTDMPSYYSLGFEVRSRNLKRAKNESYSKLYVFRINDDSDADKVTHGPFEWGHNFEHFTALSRLRKFAETIWADIKNQTTDWILAPDATAKSKLVAWTLLNKKEYVFVANLDTQKNIKTPTALTSLNDYVVVYDSSQLIEKEGVSERILPEQTLVLKKK